MQLVCRRKLRLLQRVETSGFVVMKSGTTNFGQRIPRAGIYRIQSRACLTESVDRAFGNQGPVHVRINGLHDWSLNKARHASKTRLTFLVVALEAFLGVGGLLTKELDCKLLIGLG